MPVFRKKCKYEAKDENELDIIQHDLASNGPPSDSVPAHIATRWPFYAVLGTLWVHKS